MHPRDTDGGGFYDPDSVAILTAALDDAWNSLLPAQQAHTTKADLAWRMLKIAATGERDPVRLRAAALIAPVE
jgi:hypothetical protein